MNAVTRRFVDVSIIGLLMVGLALPLLVGLSGCRRQAAGPEAIQTPPETSTQAVEPEAEMHEAVPAEYASLTNPVAHGQQAIAAGKALYDKHCVGCHGATGKGDGPKAATLAHRPANFTDPHMAAEMTDAAYFWRISEGVPDEDMPTWKGKLTETQRWQLVHFVRTFVPPTTEAAKYHCPMHPDQTSDKPAKCPVCGMNMVATDEKAAAGAGAEAGHEHAPGAHGD